MGALFDDDLAVAQRASAGVEHGDHGLAGSVTEVECCHGSLLFRTTESFDKNPTTFGYGPQGIAARPAPAIAPGWMIFAPDRSAPITLGRTAIT